MEDGVRGAFLEQGPQRAPQQGRLLGNAGLIGQLGDKEAIRAVGKFIGDVAIQLGFLGGGRTDIGGLACLRWPAVSTMKRLEGRGEPWRPQQLPGLRKARSLKRERRMLACLDHKNRSLPDCHYAYREL